MNAIYEIFGKWQLENGLEDLRTTRVISKRRKNLMGHNFEVSMVLVSNDSLNHLTDYQ